MNIKEKIGLRKFMLCIIAMVIFSITAIIIALISDSFNLSFGHIIALSIGFTGIIGLTIYGYKQEYKFKGLSLLNPKNKE